MPGKKDNCQAEGYEGLMVWKLLRQDHDTDMEWASEAS
jgi:hypothetical protein